MFYSNFGTDKVLNILYTGSSQLASVKEISHLLFGTLHVIRRNCMEDLLNHLLECVFFKN